MADNYSTVKSKNWNNQNNYGCCPKMEQNVVVVVVLLFYVHGKHLRSCRDGQFYWAGLDLLSGYGVVGWCDGAG